MQELSWILEARKHIGLKENTSKAVHNQTIVGWVKELGGWWRDDETPWCGVFVAHCLKTGGRDIPKHWYRASDYLNFGTRLDAPAYGCIAVLTRQGGGHVGFVVGKDAKGNLLLLGGNQGNQVSIAAFPPSRVSGYVWPSSNGEKKNPLSERYLLQTASAERSTSEA